MEPRIQYAQTADGVSIAFWTLGEGMALVHMPFLFSHIQLEWQMPETRRWYERLSQNRKLVRYDGRGTGLSERDVADYVDLMFMLGRDFDTELAWAQPILDDRGFSPDDRLRRVRYLAGKQKLIRRSRTTAAQAVAGDEGRA